MLPEVDDWRHCWHCGRAYEVLRQRYPDRVYCTVSCRQANEEEQKEQPWFD